MTKLGKSLVVSVLSSINKDIYYFYYFYHYYWFLLHSPLVNSSDVIAFLAGFSHQMTRAVVRPSVGSHIRELFPSDTSLWVYTRQAVEPSDWTSHLEWKSQLDDMQGSVVEDIFIYVNYYTWYIMYHLVCNYVIHVIATVVTVVNKIILRVERRGGDSEVSI